MIAALAALVLGGNLRSRWCACLSPQLRWAQRIFDPAYAAAVPTIVPPEDRPAANGLNMANSLRWAASSDHSSVAY